MKMLKYILVTVAVVSVSLLVCHADDQKPASDAQKPAADAPKPIPYPLNTCLVCGMKLGSMGAPDVFVYQGQEIKVCDKSEQADFEKSPDKYLKKLADAVAKLPKDSAAAKPVPYPLKTCLVCGMQLGMMDSKPFVFVYKGQEIKVCDPTEKATFDKDPAKYLKKLADAVAKQKN